LYFNVTHSEGLALFAVTPAGEVGVDLERVREIPEWEQIAASCFSPAERERLRSVAAAERTREFFVRWTRHEAVMKARGTGLGNGPESGDEKEFRVQAVDAGPGFVAAVALMTNDRQRIFP
ncbi:MAG: 4'-phosphopantetheinyl transferase superfamily protein, partial [Opitutaceae bacterium]